MKTVRGVLEENFGCKNAFCPKCVIRNIKKCPQINQALLALREVVVLEKRKLTPSQNFNLDYGWNSYRSKLGGKFK